MLQIVQFESDDVETMTKKLATIGISAEIRGLPCNGQGVIVAFYERGRKACKLRDFLESHHCSETDEGKILTLPVDGWETLVAAAVLH